MSSRRTQSRKPVNKTITKYDLSGPDLDKWMQEQAASKVSTSIRATPTYTNSYGQTTMRHSPPTRKQGPRKGGKTKKSKKSKRKTKKRVSKRRKTSRR